MMHRRHHLHVCRALAVASVLLLPPRAQARQPATRPAGAASQTRVLVLPFESLSRESDADGVVAEAVRRSLVIDLGRIRNLHAIESKEVAPDRAAALAAGTARAADEVVWGTVQRADGHVRITGEVLDVGRNDSAGPFKVTGSFRELFELQDALAEQVRRRLASPAKAEDDPKREAAADEPAQTRPRPKHAEVPPGEPLRVRPHPLDPDWLHPPDWTDDELAYRYNYGYLLTPGFYSDSLGCWPFGYGYGYGGYHHSFYRPYRPLYQHRYFDYIYRGIPDRRSFRGFGPRYLRSFSGPVPLRWIRPH